MSSAQRSTHKIQRATSLLLLLLGGATAATRADTAFDAPGNFNPIVPGYFADPTIERFGDRFYLYATTDGNGGGRGPATVWVSHDFVNWVLVPMNWPTTPHYWAPDVVQRPDGRYYLYYNQPCITYGGVSDTPVGPWTPLTPGDGLVIPDRLVKDVITLDTQVLEDKDGTLYGYWGTWGIFPNSGCGFGVFNPDMKSFARLGMIPNSQAKDFFEAPFMIERNGVYYFTYSSGSCHDATYRVQYAVSDRPDGEFRMGPNNPILATTEDGLVHGPGHHSILRLGDDHFIIYHRHDIPVTPNGMHRQTCADRLVFEGDGVIRKVEPTHRGVGFLGPKGPAVNLAFAKSVTASSFYQDTLRGHVYKPEYAVDDNHATLWRPGDNRMGHWLAVDLGRAQRVRRTHAQFEYATWYYQYLIETSRDGQTWTTFADRRQNTRWGSPMVDDGDVEARYVRITVTGTQLPGLFGALWNFKVFADAPVDPLLTMADQAFAAFIAPTIGPPQESPKSQIPNPKSEISASPYLIVYLDVADLPLGTSLGTWTNLGVLGGGFQAAEERPVVGMAAGRKAVRFSGKQLLRASFPAPRALAGNSSFTVAAWVNNPETAESECLISWAGRGGPDATTAQIGYGTQRDFGAVGHWGFADMGFRGDPPKAGQWHHLAVVFDGVIERLYVDGQLDNSEAKMLLMHEGRPIYVGASEPGTEFYDGYLASLRLYAGALSEAEVKKLAADAPAADVWVHLDSARLDYGPLESWQNEGALGGAFTARGRAPTAVALSSRIAARFDAGESLELVLPRPEALSDFTLLGTLTEHLTRAELRPPLLGKESAVEFLSADGARHGLLAPQRHGWHQVAMVYRGGGGTCFVNGQPTTYMAPPAPKDLRAVRVGSPEQALSRLQVFGRALSVAEVAQLHSLWKNEWQTPTPNPAAFDQKPVALTPTLVVMAAQVGQSEAGGIEYRFTKISGAPRASDGAWIPVPWFLDDGLQPDRMYDYSVQVRDALGNVTAGSPRAAVGTGAFQLEEIQDSLTIARDFLAQGVTDSIWNGFLGPSDGSAPEVIAVQEGALRLQSKGTVWDGGKPLGPFLFRLVPGDFVAQVTVADYQGLAARRVPGNNDGGLMVRVPTETDAGPGEDLVQLNFFPIWNQGNMVTVLDGGRLQKGNSLAWDAHRHLQIIRHGARFYFRTSADGVRWQDMPGSPVERKDMAGLPVQVGLYHASYGAESSFVSFRDFRLTTRK